ncbi:MAG: cytochrome c [Deltaproteobacteria bacterium]|nr:cytochrome c [Deltaproteobacteria bacterium]
MKTQLFHDVTKNRFGVLFALGTVLSFAAAFVFLLGTLPMSAAHAEGVLGDAAKGKEVYTQFCLSCHGATGKGDGPVGKNLTPKPRDMTDKERMGAMTDQHIIDVITNGGAAFGLSPLMAPWKGTLNEQQIKDVAAYVRELGK